MLLLGEAGIGKSALADALARASAAVGFAVAWGRCPDGEAPPYWPWTQALRELRAPSEAILTTTARGARAGLFASVLEAFGAATAIRPATVVLEDVHWADQSSLALLRFLAGALPGLPLLLAISARDTPADHAEGVTECLASLPTAMLRLRLGGLDPGSTAALIEAVTGRPTPPALADDVRARTGGNPFFIGEVMRLRAIRGDRSTEVPPAVQQVLSRRVARLSQAASECLAAAAVLGEPEVDRLAAMTGRPAGDVLALLDEAVASRLVISEGNRFAFAHALIREALYEDLGPAARAGLHQRAAEALEMEPGSVAGDLALHWTRAGGRKGRRTGAAHALRAAREAMARMAYEQAVRYYRWALDSGDEPPLEGLVGLGEAEVLSGSLIEGRKTLRRAAMAASDSRRAEELTRAVLAMGTGVGGFEVDVFDEGQTELLRTALALLPPGDGALRCAALARLSLAAAATEPSEARAEMAGEAAEMARRLGDAAVEVSALAALCDAISGPDHVEERLAATRRMVRLSEATGDGTLLLLARRLRLVALLERGDLVGVDAEIAAYERISRRLRLPLYAWPVPIWHGMRATMDGDLDAAWRYSEEAEELGRRAGSPNAEMMVVTLRIAVARARGTPADLMPLILANLDEVQRYPGGDCMLATIYAETGDLERARRHLRRFIDRGLGALPRDCEWLEYLWLLGDAAILLDEREAALLIHDALSPYGHLWAVDGMGGACFGPVSAQVARLATHLGRPGPVRGEPPWDGRFHRSGRVWELSFRGVAATVSDSKGVRDLAVLIQRPDRDVHVLDLVEATDGPTAASGGGGTGPLLDARARAEYAARLRELSGDIADAEANADVGRVERLVAERDLVAAELGAALGLGGRARTGGDRVERARKAVTMRIATALRAIDGAHPALGRHLRLAVRTGRVCAYRPEHPVAWRP